MRVPGSMYLSDYTAIRLTERPNWQATLLQTVEREALDSRWFPLTSRAAWLNFDSRETYGHSFHIKHCCSRRRHRGSLASSEGSHDGHSFKTGPPTHAAHCAA